MTLADKKCWSKITFSVKRKFFLSKIKILPILLRPTCVSPLIHFIFFLWYTIIYKKYFILCQIFIRYHFMWIHRIKRENISVMIHVEFKWCSVGPSACLGWYFKLYNFIAEILNTIKILIWHFLGENFKKFDRILFDLFF